MSWNVSTLKFFHWKEKAPIDIYVSFAMDNIERVQRQISDGFYFNISPFTETELSVLSFVIDVPIDDLIFLSNNAAVQGFPLFVSKDGALFHQRMNVTCDCIDLEEDFIGLAERLPDDDTGPFIFCPIKDLLPQQRH